MSDHNGEQYEAEEDRQRRAETPPLDAVGVNRNVNLAQRYAAHDVFEELGEPVSLFFDNLYGLWSVDDERLKGPQLSSRSILTRAGLVPVFLSLSNMQ